MVAWMRTSLKGYSIQTGFMAMGFCSSYTLVMQIGEIDEY